MPSAPRGYSKCRGGAFQNHPRGIPRNSLGGISRIHYMGGGGGGIPKCPGGVLPNDPRGYSQIIGGVFPNRLFVPGGGSPKCPGGYSQMTQGGIYRIALGGYSQIHYWGGVFPNALGGYSQMTKGGIPESIGGIPESIMLGGSPKCPGGYPK